MAVTYIDQYKANKQVDNDKDLKRVLINISIQKNSIEQISYELEDFDMTQANLLEIAKHLAVLVDIFLDKARDFDI